MKNKRCRSFGSYYKEGYGNIDRISDLPINVIDDILGYLSIKDITRMSVLSKYWNHIWSTHPNLVLDQHFCETTNGLYKNIVTSILLQHTGPIIKFVVDISSVDDLNHWVIDGWLLHIFILGTVQELIVQNAVQHHLYTFPCFFFNNSKLRYLSLTYCIFKSPITTTSFNYLERLELMIVTFEPIMASNIVVTPLLSVMKLTGCNGIQYLNISAPQLRTLHIVESHQVELEFLKAYPNLRTLIIYEDDRIHNYEYYWRRFTFAELICSFHKLLALHFSRHFFKSVVPNSVPKRFGTPVDLQALLLGVQILDLAQIEAVICLIQSAPRLQLLNIQHEHEAADDVNVEAVSNYLGRPDCVEADLMALKWIKLENFGNTPAELLFMKLLFARSPSLIEVIVKPSRSLENDELREFYFELLQFPRASPYSKLVLYA